MQISILFQLILTWRFIIVSSQNLHSDPEDKEIKHCMEINQLYQHSGGSGCRCMTEKIEGITKIEISCDGKSIQNITISLSMINMSVNSLLLDQIQDIEASNWTFIQSLRDLDVKKLAITSSSIKNLQPRLFSNVTVLEELDLNNNELTTLSPEDLMGLDHIQVLDLSHNRIASLTDVFKSVPSLETLDLSQNSLQELPTDVFLALENLKVLKLNGNPLKSLYKKAMKGLSGLLQFHARDCGLSHLDNTLFDNMDYLKIIDLGHNRINEILPPKVLSKKMFLKILKLDNNQIEEIEDKHFGSLYLKVLDLSGNRINKIGEDTFIDFHVTKLDLSYNTIVSLKPELFSPLANQLTHLNVAHNPLRTIKPQVFHKLQLLESLNMSSCHIDSLDNELFANLVHLQTIDISENNIHYIPPKILKMFEKIKIILLDDNTWVCDCNIESFHEWLIKPKSIAKLACQSIRAKSKDKPNRFALGPYVEKWRGDHYDKTEVSYNPCEEPMCAAPSSLSGVKVSTLTEEFIASCRHANGKGSSDLPAAVQIAIVVSCMGVALIFLMITIYLWKRGKTSQGLRFYWGNKRICAPSNAESSHSQDEDTNRSPLHTNRASLTESDHEFAISHYFKHLVTDPSLMSRTTDSDNEEGGEGKKEKDSLYSSQHSIFTEPPAAFGTESTV